MLWTVRVRRSIRVPIQNPHVVHLNYWWVFESEGCEAGLGSVREGSVISREKQVSSIADVSASHPHLIPVIFILCRCDQDSPNLIVQKECHHVQEVSGGKRSTGVWSSPSLWLSTEREESKPDLERRGNAAMNQPGDRNLSGDQIS